MSIATITALLQVILKAHSRPSPGPGTFWWNNYKREDAVFWSDWVVAGAIAAVVYVLKSMSAGHHLDVWQVTATFVILVAASLFLPAIVGKILYDGAGQLRSGYFRIMLGNSIGLLVLVGSVFGGAQIG